MSTSGQQQQQSSFQQRLVQKIEEMDDKVDSLTTSLQGLTVSDDLRQTISQQIEELRQQIRGELTTIASRPNKSKVKKAKPFDGKTQTLRSFLTAIELEIEDEGIVEDEAKVKYAGRYLRDDPWEWFEPIIRERNEINRKDWSLRAERILTSYNEMKKAMKQVLGDIDERKTNYRS
jgi:hypothetical protein